MTEMPEEQAHNGPETVSGSREVVPYRRGELVLVRRGPGLRRRRQSHHYEMVVHLTITVPAAITAGAGVAAASFAKAFTEKLGEQTAEATLGLVRKIRHKSKETPETQEVDDGATTVAITQNLPDEARLALLDLEGTALERMRGKYLRWDEKSMAWLPDSAEKPKKPDLY